MTRKSFQSVATQANNPSSSATIHFTADAINSLSSTQFTNLDDWNYHEDVKNGVKCLIITSHKKSFLEDLL